MLRSVIALGLLLALLGGAAMGRFRQEPEPKGALVLGMTAEEVRALFGQPDAVARQVYANGCLEQWSYRAPRRQRLTFEYEKGKKSRLVEIRELVPR